MSILTAFSLCLLLLSGCRSSSKPQEEPNPRAARDATVYSAIVARAIAASPPTHRPGAPIGVHISMYLSAVEIPVHGALDSIAILAPLARSPATAETPFVTIQILGTLVQTNIVEAMNRTPDRGDVLNRHLALLRSALQDAQRDKEHVEESRRQLLEKERNQRNAIRTLQKETDAAEKAGDFAGVGSQQRALSNAKGEHGQTEISLEELKNTAKILEDLANLAEERLHAIEQNREALMSGVRIVEIPGIETLGILEKGTKSRRSPAQRGQKWTW